MTGIPAQNGFLSLRAEIDSNCQSEALLYLINFSASPIDPPNEVRILRIFQKIELTIFLITVIAKAAYPPSLPFSLVLVHIHPTQGWSGACSFRSRGNAS